jgi:hypothetical protein
LGTCVGDLIYAILALAGMTVLLQYETVRWVLWIGGSALLIYFAAKMIYSAIHHEALLAETAEVGSNSHRKEFFRGNFPRHVVAQRHSLVRRSGRHADRPFRWRWSAQFGAVPWRLPLCRAAVVRRPVLCR